MVSTTSIVALIAYVAATVNYVQAHGYIADPKISWKKEETNDWVVQIAPQWVGNWDQTSGDEGLLSLFKELGAANNFKNLRSLMDGNPVYGEECGFSDPNGTPAVPPSNGEATFSRGMVHAGPCEIWLDDKKVLQNDDCQSAYGDGTQATITRLKPVDYSLCAVGGCMLRFYWLALQRLDGKTVWQVYKNCIPLTGPPGENAAGAPATPPSDDDSDPTQQYDPKASKGSPSTGDSPNSESNGDKAKKDSDPPSTQDSNSPSTKDSDSKSNNDSAKKDSDSPSTQESNSPSTKNMESKSNDDKAKKDSGSPSAKDSDSNSKNDSDSQPKEDSYSKKDSSAKDSDSKSKNDSDSQPKEDSYSKKDSSAKDSESKDNSDSKPKEDSYSKNDSEAKKDSSAKDSDSKSKDDSDSKSKEDSHSKKDSNSPSTENLDNQDVASKSEKDSSDKATSSAPSKENNDRLRRHLLQIEGGR